MAQTGPDGRGPGGGGFSDRDVLGDLESILGDEFEVLPPRAEELAEERYELDQRTTEELIANLPSILRIFGRELRLGRKQTLSGVLDRSGSSSASFTATSQNIAEVHGALGQLLDRHSEIHLRVKIDGLYIGGSSVYEILPREDRALFRLFQHGVRQFSLSQGLTISELEGFVEVLTTDPDSLDNIEEDISTLLVDQEFESIHFVVVDTFTEGGLGGASNQHRAADLAELVSAAIRETLTDHPEMAGDPQGGTVRFMAADVTFLEQHDIGSLLNSLRSQKSEDLEQSRPDDELAAMGREVREAMGRWTPWLPQAVLGAFQGATNEEVEALCHLLGTHLLGDAQRLGLASIEREILSVGRWLDERGEADAQTRSVASALFTPRLSRIALTALRSGNPEDELAAVDVFRRLTFEERGKALVDICRLPPGPSRAGAIVALLHRPRPVLDALHEHFPSFDVSAARAVLGALSDASEDEIEAIRVFQIALTYPDASVRAESLAWFMDHAGDRAAAALSDALRDEDSTVRKASLFLIVERQPTYGAAILKTWFGTSFFKKLPLEEKRLGACGLAAVAGDSSLPAFRKVIKKLNITGDGHLDETRAAAVAALGMLGDVESEQRIAKLAKSRLCGHVLQEEAKHVASALKRGTLPYQDTLLQLRETAVEAGLLDEVSPARREMTTVPERPSPDEGQSTQRVPEPQKAASGSPAPAEAIVEELLMSYSFDDLPSAMPLPVRKDDEGDT